jgi:hypothetical protein
MQPATKADWRIAPLPEKQTTIRLDRTFSTAEMASIQTGSVPDEMEDKWFVYFDSGRLHFHRSWTGYCIYIVEFVQDGAGGQMVEAQINRDPQQYNNVSDDYDQRMISYLIDILLLRRPAEFPADDRSPDEIAVEQWGVVGRAMFGERPQASSSEHEVSFLERTASMHDFHSINWKDDCRAKSPERYTLHDYINLIRHLDALRSHFVVNWDDRTCDFFEMEQDLKRLRRIRIHDVFDKLRFSQLVQRVVSTLQSDGFNDIVDHNMRNGPPGQIAVTADMTHGMGLFDLKYVILNDERTVGPVLLGVQIQNAQFRLDLEVRKKAAGKARTLAEALLNPTSGKRIWFDLSLVDTSNEEVPKNDGFNQYSGAFFYRYKKVASMPAQRLVDTIVAYARLIQENEAALRRQIEAALGK